MRIVFAGTPAFAQSALAALHAAGHEIALVLTQPDRPAGRGMRPQASAVKQHALAHGWPLCQPTSLRLDGKHAQEARLAQTAIAAAQAHVMVVAAYGLLLPGWTLQSVPMGCLNIHASLLPRWRGAAPIQRAIEAGDPQTGVCIMQMDEGLDTGAVLMRQAMPITAEESTSSLLNKLAALGAELVVQTLAHWPQLKAMPQPTEGVTYATKITKDEAIIDWRMPAQQLSHRIRAFDPFPGALTSLRGKPLKVWSAQAVPDAPVFSPGLSAMVTHPTALPGTVLQASGDLLSVATGQGALRLLQLQLPGGKRLSAAEFMHSQQQLLGLQLG